MNKNIKINGTKYNNVSKIKIKDADTENLHDFVNTDDATVGSFDVLFGKVAYGKDGKVFGAYVPPSTVGSGETDYEEEGINFYDYYGQKIASYLLTDLPLSALPEIPALDGVGADGYTFAWNKTLDEVNALTEPADIAVDVTATSAKTYIIPRECGIPAKSCMLYFYGGTTAAKITVDWGDGSTPSSYTMSANKIGNAQHSYTEVSHNPIVIEKVSGGDFYLGSQGTTGTSYQSSPFLGNYRYNNSSMYQLFDSVGEIRVGSGVIGLSNGALYTAFMEKIILPNTITYLGAYAFYQCHQLRCVNIPKSVTSIESNNFYQCYSLESVVIPDGVTSIGVSAFHSCRLLESVKIPDGVTSIRQSAFSTCSILRSIKIPDGVTEIAPYMVSSCPKLTNVEIPASVTKIGNSAFANCSRLTSIEIPDGVTSIGTSAFQSCSELTSIKIPEGVTTIGANAFQSCSELTSIEIPDGVTSIGTSAFQSCYNLQSVKIPEGVTTIGANAFNGCSILRSIEIPENVTSIGSQVVYEAYALQYIKMKGATPPTLGGSLESYYNSFFKILVPTGSLSAYATATNWTASALRMEEY